MAVVFQDDRRAYHLFASYMPGTSRGAQQILVYQAILDSTQDGLDFDFEGSMIPGVARYNSEFNAELEPYYVISDYSPRMKFRMNMKENLRIAKDWVCGRGKKRES